MIDGEPSKVFPITTKVSSINYSKKSSNSLSYCS